MGTPQLAEKKGPRVLFVCTANICRSPMAQALFQVQLRKTCPNEWQEWRVESAGTWALDGKPASKYSQKVMAKRGINIGNHSARTVSADLLNDFDLILTMEPGHKEALRIEFPAISERVYLLSEMIEKEEPVEDPYGGPQEKYEETAKLLETFFEKGINRIISLAQMNFEKKKKIH